MARELRTCTMSTIIDRRMMPPKGNEHARGSNPSRAIDVCSHTLGPPQAMKNSDVGACALRSHQVWIFGERLVDPLRTQLSLFVRLSQHAPCIGLVFWWYPRFKVDQLALPAAPHTA